MPLIKRASQLIGSSPSEFQKPKYGFLAFFWLRLRFLGSLLILPRRFIAFAVLEMFEYSALCYTEHIPNAFEVGLIFVLHRPQSFVHRDDPLLDGLHLELNEGGDTFLEGSVVDFIKVELLALLIHQTMHFGEGNIFSNFVERWSSDLIRHTFSDLDQDSIVFLHYFAQLPLNLAANQIVKQLADLLDDLFQLFRRRRFGCKARLQLLNELRIAEELVFDGCDRFDFHF